MTRISRLARTALATGALVLALAGSASAFTATKTFNNAAGDWNTAANWTPNGVPGTSDDVLIPAGKAATISAAATGIRTLDIEGTGKLTISGNALSVGGGAQASVLDGDANTTQLLLTSGGSLSLGGTTNWINGDLGLGSAAGDVLTIPAAATLSIQNTGPSGQVTMVGGTSTAFHVLGTVSTDGSAYVPPHIHAPVDNDGTITSSFGLPLDLTGGGAASATSTGSFDLGGGVLQLGGALPIVVGSGGSIKGSYVHVEPGVVQLQSGSTYKPQLTCLDGGTLTVAAGVDNATTIGTDTGCSGTGTRDGAGTLKLLGFVSAGVHLGGGRTEVSGGVNILSGLTIDGGGVLAMNSGDWNAGDLKLGGTGSGTIEVRAGGEFLPHPTSGTASDLGGGLIHTLPGDPVGGKDPGMIYAYVGTVPLDVPVQNDGRILSDYGGTVLRLGPVTQGATGETTAGGSGGAARIEAALTMNGGVLDGRGTLKGAVANPGGMVAPGLSAADGPPTIGTLTIDGTYLQGAGGGLRPEIAGTSPGSQFDRLAVTGAATLDGGTMDIRTDGAFTPAKTDTFQVLGAASVGGAPGAFTSLLNKVVGPLTYVEQDHAADVTLAFVDTPATPAPTPTPTPTPGPAPTGAPAPSAPSAPAATVSAAEVIGLPSTKACVSRRSFRIRLRQPRGVTIVRATVAVNGRQVKVVTGRRLTAPVDLKGLPKGRFTVKVTVFPASGAPLHDTRRYRTCTPKGH